MDIRLRPDAEMICQPFGSFLVSRALKRFDVLDHGATGLMLRLVPGASVSDLEAAAITHRLAPGTATGLVEAMDLKGYLVKGRGFGGATVSFVEDRHVLKATRAEIEVTNRCNLNCTYCYAEVNTSSVELSDEQLREVIDGMYAHGLRAVLLSGGEPFLRRGFTEFVEWAAERLIVEINTNGRFVTEDRAARLAAADVKLVQVSLDSPTAAYHDSVRGDGSHSRAVTAIERLVHAGVPTQASCVITGTNRPLLSQLRLFVESLGARFKADPVTRTGYARDIPDERWEREFQASRADRVQSTDPTDAGLGFEPICQSQVGYVAVSHHGYLKPCNMREQFFAPTGGALVDTSRWWERYYGETRIASIASGARKPNAALSDTLMAEAGGYLCDLQLAAAASGMGAKRSVPVALVRKPVPVAR